VTIESAGLAVEEGSVMYRAPSSTATKASLASTGRILPGPTTVKPPATGGYVSPESGISQKERALAQKERELAEREKAIEDSLEQLECDTRSLEEALKRYEQEDASIQERERLLKEREEALASLAARLEQAEGKQAPGQVHEDAQKLVQQGEEAYKRIAEDMRAQKERLDREIEERMERLKTLQKLVSAASGLPATEPAAEPEPDPGDLESLIRKEQAPGFDPYVVGKALEQLDQEMRLAAAQEDKLQVEILSTHDERLDYILGGGVPMGHVMIVNGSPGSMKSTLSYYIMYNAVTRSGKRGMYFSLEQKRDSIIRQMERMGMPRAAAEEGMMVVDMVDLRKAMKDENGDWRQIMMRYVQNVHAEMPFDLFVLDSLESFKSIAMFDFSRQHMMDLFEWFKSLNITVLVIAERTKDDSEAASQETYLADGVIELQMKEFEDAKVHRWLRCTKMRGMQNDPRFYAFYHNGQEFKFSLPLVGTGV
jgi:KaiC/GvpD/RAD55 family RecA-like ATPase